MSCKCITEIGGTLFPSEKLVINFMPICSIASKQLASTLIYATTSNSEISAFNHRPKVERNVSPNKRIDPVCLLLAPKSSHGLKITIYKSDKIIYLSFMHSLSDFGKTLQLSKIQFHHFPFESCGYSKSRE